MNEESGEGSARRIQVRFVTKLNAPFVVPSTAIAIPADLTRFGLSSLVNALIQSNGNFHFLSHFQTPPCSIQEYWCNSLLVDFCRCWLWAWAVWFFDRWRVRADVARAVSSRQGNLCGNNFKPISKCCSTSLYNCMIVCVTDSDSAH